MHYLGIPRYNQSLSVTGNSKIMHYGTHFHMPCYCTSDRHRLTFIVVYESISMTRTGWVVIFVSNYHSDRSNSADALFVKQLKVERDLRTLFSLSIQLSLSEELAGTVSYIQSRWHVPICVTRKVLRMYFKYFRFV